MAVNILLELTASPGKVEDIKAYFSEILPETRTYPGYIDLHLLENLDNPDNLVVYETWESREAYQAYFNWRAQQGVFDKLAAFIEGQPSVRFLQDTGI